MRRVTDQKSRAAGHRSADLRGKAPASPLYIYDHLDGDLSLDAVADVACMSPHHWHRVFRAMTGETLADAIRRVRLLKAANALVNEDAPVADIAERFGYPNLASFSRAFSAQHGKPPGAFRNESHERAATLRQATGDHPMYPVVIQNLAASRAAGVLHVGPYEGLGLAFQKLGAVIAARNLLSHVEGMIVVYHDAPGRSRTRTCTHTRPSSGPPGSRQISKVWSISIWSAASTPSCSTTALTRRWAVRDEWLYGKWLPQFGEEPRSAPPIELYVNDPRTTPPEQLRTDVRLPLA